MTTYTWKYAGNEGGNAYAFNVVFDSTTNNVTVTMTAGKLEINQFWFTDFDSTANEFAPPDISTSDPNLTISGAIKFKMDGFQQIDPGGLGQTQNTPPVVPSIHFLDATDGDLTNNSFTEPASAAFIAFINAAAEDPTHLGLGVRAQSVNNGGSLKLIDTPDIDDGGGGNEVDLFLEKHTVCPDGDGEFHDFGSFIFNSDPLLNNDVKWIYDLTNTGDDTITGVTLVDDNGPFGDIIPTAILGADGVHNLGDADKDGDLDPGETWHYEATAKVVLGDYVNEATAKGTDSKGVVQTAKANSGYTGYDPDIDIHVEKTTSGLDVLGQPQSGSNDVNIAAGSQVTWTYVVTNTGNDGVHNVKITDNAGTTGTTADDFDPTPVLSGGFNVGDTNKDGVLDKGENWQFTATDTADAGKYENKVVVTGESAEDVCENVETDTADDTSSYFGQTLSLDLTKDVLCGDSGKVLSAGDPSLILVGEDLKWRVTVKNTGNFDLDQGDDYFKVVDVEGVALTLDPLSDVNSDGILSKNETWYYYSSVFEAKAGVNSNTAKAVGADGTALSSTTFDTDSASYKGVVASINIDKTTTGKDLLGISHTGDGYVIKAGEAVTWTYTVTNTGDVALKDVVVSDDKVVVSQTHTGDTNNNGLLDTTETWVYKATGVAGTGNYNNTGTVTASYKDDCGNLADPAPSDTDNSSYFGFKPTTGYTIGYWYTHLGSKYFTGDANASAELKAFGAWAPYMVAKSSLGGAVPATSSNFFLRLGDENGDGVQGGGEKWLYVDGKAAMELINSSQTANDVRQILFSQAIATQLNIDLNHGGPAGLITDAVKWLTGTTALSDGSVPNVDGLSDGYLTAGTSASFDYNLTAHALTADANTAQKGGQLLSSSTKVWQEYANANGAPYFAADYNFINDTVAALNKPISDEDALLTPTPYLANGEGLKNALQAYNQGNLVTDATNTANIWLGAGDPGALVQNGYHDFWTLLSHEAAYGPNGTLLKGIEW